jgi:hypothetical protein
MKKYYSVLYCFVITAIFSLGCTLIRGENFADYDGGEIKRSLLRVDGYYYSVREKGYDFRNGTTILPILLWEDGTTARFFVEQGKNIQTEKLPLQFGTLREAREIFENKLDSMVKGDEKMGKYNWGTFRVRKDSISIQVMRPVPGFLFIVPIVPVEYNGIILNDTTFVLKKRISRGNPAGPFEGTRRLNQMYHFCPLGEGEKPPSDNWTQTHPELQ